MTKDEYLKFHKEFCEKMVEITKVKNAVYGKRSRSFWQFQSS